MARVQILALRLTAVDGNHLVGPDVVYNDAIVVVEGCAHVEKLACEKTELVRVPDDIVVGADDFEKGAGGAATDVVGTFGDYRRHCLWFGGLYGYFY